MNLFFSDTLRKLRNEKGLSQTELAERVYVTRSTVVRWETGSRLPDATVILRLAKAFGKGTGYALGLAFLSAIFLPMLAFGKARYQGVVQQPTTFR